MKIVCDACQAKYSISDDKVQGKVFKIRCKKCSNIIVVRGGASSADPAPAPAQEKDTRVYDYGYEGGDAAPAGDDAVWHVVINQEQIGPMSAVEVQRRFSAGEIDAETYVWREGFADWLPLAQVDAFAQLASAPAPAARAPGAEAVAAMFGAGDDAAPARSDPADLFAAASAGSSRRADDAGDAFAGKTGQTATPAAQGNAKLRGERNENSVLFSLNNLAQLASDKPAPAPSSGSSTSLPQMGGGGGGGGAAGGEGSGLIDIRSMASAYLGATGAAKPAAAGVGSIDDLPVFGNAGFSEPAVMVPMAPRAANNNKLLYVLIGSVGLLVVAAAIVVVVLMRDRGGSPAQVATGDKPEATAPGGEAKPTPTEPGGPTKPSEPRVAAGDPGKPEPVKPAPGAEPTKPVEPKAPDAGKGPAVPKPDEPKRPAPPPAAPHKAPTPTGAAAHPSPKPPAPDKPAPAPDKPVQPKSGGDSCDEVSCVLNNYEGACCQKFRKSGGKAAPSPAAGGAKGDLPDALDRDLIREGVDKVKGRAQACGSSSSAHGQVKVSVRVGPDGHVAGVTVKSTPDDALGNCVAGAMQKATFARTQNGGSFSYPFTF